MDKTRSRSLLWIFPVVLILALAVFAIGAYFVAKNPADNRGFAILAAGVLAFFAVLGSWCLALSIHAGRHSDLRQVEALIGPVNERLQHISVLLNMVTENQLISERAKQIAFRDNERDVLRRAIREEISRKDYEAALTLASSIESNFGYKQEADRFREEVFALRDGEARKKISEVMTVVERCCLSEQWNQALREAEQLQQEYPGDASVAALPAEIEKRRQGHKQQLRDSWQQAVDRHDVDGSIEILKQLDPYLTPAEAEAMQEAARKVFKDKLQILGQQFTLAVKEHNLAEAIRIGETVMRDFPNSLMAKEISGKMDLLRQRASTPEPAKV